MTKLSDELLPCPFCGGKGYVYEIHDKDLKMKIIFKKPLNDRWFIRCSNDYCAVSTPIILCREDPNREEIIKIWNTRISSSKTSEKNEDGEKALNQLNKEVTDDGCIDTGFHQIRVFYSNTVKTIRTALEQLK